VVMAGNVFHVPAMVEQSVDIANICISDYFRCPVSAQSRYFCNFTLGPSEAVKPDDHAVSVCSLPGTDI